MSDKHLSRYKKEVLKTGTYVFDGIDWVVDLELMDSLVAGTTDSGWRMFIPIDHNKDPEENKGWVDSLLIEQTAEGHSMFAIMDILDPGTDEKIRDGLLADASVSIYHDYVDSKGVQHPDVIREISVTNEPFITGMTGYERAMNEDGSSVKEIILSEKNRIKNMEDKSMSNVIKQVKDLFKIDSDKRVTELKEDKGKLEKTNKELTGKLETADKELKTLKEASDVTQAAQADKEWTNSWEGAVTERKVEPGKLDEFKKDFPTKDGLDLVLSKMTPRTDLSTATVKEPVKDEPVIEGLSVEVVDYLKEKGMTVEEINKYK